MAFSLIPSGIESSHHEFPLSSGKAAIAQKARRVALDPDPYACLPPLRRVNYKAWCVLWVVSDS